MPVLTVPELELDSASSLSVSMIFLNASSSVIVWIPFSKVCESFSIQKFPSSPESTS